MSEQTITEAPAFSLQATCGKQISLAGLKGQKFILYFYPKDNTPGCTTEAVDYAGHYEAFRTAGYEVFGVSRDSIASHDRFREKLGLPFDLLSDPDEQACHAYGVMKQKKMYGRDVHGIERSTFVIDAAGKVLKIWRGVKVPGHVEEVLNFIRQSG